MNDVDARRLAHYERVASLMSHDLGRAEAVIRDLQARLREFEWRPIDETTPRDGTAIYLYWPRYEGDERGFRAIGRWKTNPRLARTRSNGSPNLCGKDLEWVEREGIAESYFSDSDELDDYEMAKAANAPTHWMPLPEPPREVKR